MRLRAIALCRRRARRRRGGGLEAGGGGHRLVRGARPPASSRAALAAAGQDWAERRDRRAEGDARPARRPTRPAASARSRSPGRSSTPAASRTPPRSRAAAPLPPPPFALELLRNEADVSLIGLVPETGGRDVIRAALGAGGLGEQRHRHARGGLRPGAGRLAGGARLRPLGAGRAAARQDQRGARHGCAVVAVADSDADRERAGGAAAAGDARGGDARPRHLGAAAGDRALRLRFQPATTAWRRLDACSAESPEAAGGDPRRGARRRASPDAADCRVGPRRRRRRTGRRRWRAGSTRCASSAAGASRSATSAAELTAPGGHAARQGWPRSRRRSTRRCPTASALTHGGAAGAGRDRRAPRRRPPPQFEATLPPRTAACGSSGPVQRRDLAGGDPELRRGALRPRPGDATTIEIDPALPDGWPGRVLAGVEALAALKAGQPRR